jgi:hypothetical protein
MHRSANLFVVESLPWAASTMMQAPGQPLDTVLVHADMNSLKAAFTSR